MPQSSGSVRVVFWNTWLLRPRLWTGGPVIPGIERLAAPAVGRRARLVGEALVDRFDVCALSEVFDPKEQEQVAEAWDEAEYQPGPGAARLRPTGSGLMTIIDPTQVLVEATADHAYRSGGDLRDSDTMANKGALMVRVRMRPGGPSLDVFSTHLLNGGELLPLPGANDHSRHHRARMAQVDELVEFIARERDPHNPVLLVGDLNVAAHDHRVTGPVDASYRDLQRRLEPLGFVDLWATEGVGPGFTCDFEDPEQLPADPGFPDAVLDDPDQDPDTRRPCRIDYLWLAPATKAREDAPSGQPVTVAVDRPRRWAFPGREARGGPGGSLSDHLALSVTLHMRD